jgi:hypothetical protein
MKLLSKTALMMLLIAITFIFTACEEDDADMNAPSVLLNPNSSGVITKSEVDRALDAHFSGSSNRGKTFTPKFGAGTTSIGEYAFQYCSTMVLTSLPESVTTIDD